MKEVREKSTGIYIPKQYIRIYELAQKPKGFNCARFDGWTPRAYLNIPVISLFGAQNPELTKPLGDGVQVLKPNKKCDHIRDHWRLCSLCMDEIPPEKVLKSIFKVIK